MPSHVAHKRVEFTELFYDLVFVYAISKTTALIHHLHHGLVSWESMFSFLLSLLILVNSWMIQTVFTNRFGKNSLLNILVMFTNMGLLLLISSMITNDWQEYYNYFCWVVGTLTFTLFLQYLVEYKRKDTSSRDKANIRGFLLMTGLRTLALYVAALLPLEESMPVYLIGVLVTFIMPVFNNRKDAGFAINFPHLIERISLLVIITFGEMIMGIANFFTPETISFNSVLYFLIMALLFLFYFGQFDHAIDEAKDTKGLYLIYSHYPIFIGLLMMTVSMNFFADASVNHLFALLFFYLGLALFQWSVLSNNVYNKFYLKYDKKFFSLQALWFLLA